MLERDFVERKRRSPLPTDDEIRAALWVFTYLDVAHTQWQYSFDCLIAEEAGTPTPPPPEPPAHIREDVLRELSDIPPEEWLDVLPFVMTRSEREDLRVNIPKETVAGYVRKLWEQFDDQTSLDLNDIIAYGDINEWRNSRRENPVKTNINDSCYALWLLSYHDSGEAVADRTAQISAGFYQGEIVPQSE